MSKTRCFVLEPVKHNIDDAHEFGQITYLFQTDEDRPSIFSEAYPQLIARKFDSLGFCPDSDFFVLTGYQIALVVAIAVLVNKYSSFEVLAFHAPTHAYTQLTIGAKQNVA